MAAMRRCPGNTRPDGTPGPCPHLIPPGTRYCPTHQAAYDARRGTSTARGYGQAHRTTRAAWAPLVQAGGVRCWRCGQLIEPGEPFDLGHDDHDRSITRGPEHQRCNRSAAGRSAHPQP